MYQNVLLLLFQTKRLLVTWLFCSKKSFRIFPYWMKNWCKNGRIFYTCRGIFSLWIYHFIRGNAKISCFFARNCIFCCIGIYRSNQAEIFHAIRSIKAYNRWCHSEYQKFSHKSHFTIWQRKNKELFCCSWSKKYIFPLKC